MSVNKFPTNKSQVISAKYPERGFAAYENKGSRPYVSQSAVENLVQWSNQAVAVGTLSPGSPLTYTAELNPTDQFSNMANMANCYVTVHIGSVASANTQIYPTIGTADPADFQMWGGFDYLQVNNPYNSCFTLFINNVGTQDYVLYYYNRWQYVQSNSGASND